tara:strand:- start:161598 stop:162770 length:1173 start_codon:yes stop_codon:yes gene_type:complete
MLDPNTDSPTDGQPASNRYDRMEWAGAFGDLGTLIPFVIAYIGVVKMAPFGILFSFGLAMLVCGVVYKTPFPVQPMKAIGAIAAIQAVQTGVVTPAVIYSATLVTGGVWLVLGLTGMATRIARLVPAAVVMGIVFGLGMGFMLQGVKMMQANWVIAAIGGLLTLLLMGNRRIPAMLVLLVFGIAIGAWQQPTLLSQLSQIGVGFTLPQIVLGELSWNQFWVGVFLLALPQLPLTLGNAVIAIKAENNKLFPHHPVSESKVATSTGIMNLLGATVGGVPMCHGAGGMAGHIAFGARTGGALVILGSILLMLAFFFSASIGLLFQLFPEAILGVILFLTGLQLALGSSVFPERRCDRAIVLITAALCIWNVAVGFIVGIALHHLSRRVGLHL